MKGDGGDGGGIDVGGVGWEVVLKGGGDNWRRLF